MRDHAGEASEQYHDGNDRDIRAKQSESVADSNATDDPAIDESRITVLPGTGGPDDVGDVDVEPSDYNRSGH